MVRVEYGDLSGKIDRTVDVENTSFKDVLVTCDFWVNAEGGTKNRSIHATEYDKWGNVIHYRRVLPARCRVPVNSHLVREHSDRR